MKRLSLNNALTWVMLVVILSTVGTLIYVFIAPPKTGSLTEFYILGKDGIAIDYPLFLRVDEPGTVLAGIMNREDEDYSYTIDVFVGGISQQIIGPISLKNGEKWEDFISFSFDQPGEKQKVSFVLRRGAGDKPSLEVYLTVDVVPQN